MPTRTRHGGSNTVAVSCNPGPSPIWSCYPNVFALHYHARKFLRVDWVRKCYLSSRKHETFEIFHTIDNGRVGYPLRGCLPCFVRVSRKAGRLGRHAMSCLWTREQFSWAFVWVGPYCLRVPCRMVQMRMM